MYIVVDVKTVNEGIFSAFSVIGGQYDAKVEIKRHKWKLLLLCI